MFRIKLSGVLLLLLLVVAAGCGSSGGPDPNPNPNPNFERMTAQVFSASGEPLSGLSIRVEGNDTGLVTSASGGFSLEAGEFPNGVNAANEITFGRGGFVVGSREIVPVNSTNVTITFGDPGSAADSGRISGTVTSANSGTPLDGVEVTLFSLDGGVFQTHTSSGAYSINDVPAGSWQLAANFAGYNPVMAFVQVTAGQNTDFDVALKQDGVVAPGDGLKVHGVLRDSETGQPISGAFLSLSADTGYYGILDGRELPAGAPQPGTDPATGVGVGTATWDADGRESSMVAPIWYDPQYQETTTEADGSFEFPNEVVGYNIYVNISADSYLLGSYFQEIYGLNGSLELELELTPIKPADISGIVRDGEGNPVEGALVEFIFSGAFGGGGKPMDDFAVPPMANFEDFAADGTATRDNVGAPVPSPEWGEAAPGAPGNDSQAGSGGAGNGPSGLDNLLMQRFRHEHQNNDGRDASDLDNFDGYMSYVTGPDGRYEFSEVPAGSYWVIAGAYRHESTEMEFEAQPSPTPNDLPIVIEEIPVGVIEGTVVEDGTGIPIEDVLVNAVLPTIDPFDYTDASGHFRIENVPVAEGWIVGAYKAGYLTSTETVNVTDGGTVTVNLRLTRYEAPSQDMVNIFGTIYDSSDPGVWDEFGAFTGGSGVAGADIVFTPLDNSLGSFFRHVLSDNGGQYSTDLVNGADYNLLIQAEGFQDLFTRVWPNHEWRQMDFWMAPVHGTPGQGGGNTGGFPGGGGTIEPWPVPDAPPPTDGDGGDDEPIGL